VVVGGGGGDKTGDVDRLYSDTRDIL
jgi:hypothetical protein